MDEQELTFKEQNDKSIAVFAGERCLGHLLPPNWAFGAPKLWAFTPKTSLSPVGRVLWCESRDYALKNLVLVDGSMELFELFCEQSLSVA